MIMCCVVTTRCMVTCLRLTIQTLPVLLFLLFRKKVLYRKNIFVHRVHMEEEASQGPTGPS
jgi:hypothetical protein